MASSCWLRRGALAGAGIEISPTAGTEARTIFPTQHVRRRGECQLLPDRLTQLDGRGARRKLVYARVVRRVWIVTEQDAHVRVDVVNDAGEAAAAVSPHIGLKPAAPEVLAGTRGLQPTFDRDRSGQLEVQALECRIVRLKPAEGLDRTSVEIPQVDPKHSQLS
jgi:hypothetical protein